MGIGSRKIPNMLHVYMLIRKISCSILGQNPIFLSGSTVLDLLCRYDDEYLNVSTSQHSMYRLRNSVYAYYDRDLQILLNNTNLSLHGLVLVISDCVSFLKFQLVHSCCSPRHTPACMYAWMDGCM